MKKRELKRRIRDLEQVIADGRGENARLMAKMANIQAHIEVQQTLWRKKSDWLKNMWANLQSCRHNRNGNELRREWEKLEREGF